MMASSPESSSKEGRASRADVAVAGGQRDWDDLASVDALWAVCVEADRQHGRWTSEEFFATGEQEIEQIMAAARALELPHHRERALDFGCGPGRLTRALSSRFARCVGVDVSDEMITRARELNPDVKNCEFVLNGRPDLELFDSGTFDFVYSSKVLQHMPHPNEAIRYVQEFIRVVRDDGVVVFQLPYTIGLRRRLQPRRRLYRPLRALGFSPVWLYNRLGLNPMKTIAVGVQDVVAAVLVAGGKIVQIVPVEEEPNPSLFYFVARR